MYVGKPKTGKCDMNCEERCMKWLMKPVEIKEA